MWVEEGKQGIGERQERKSAGGKGGALPTCGWIEIGGLE